MQSLLISVVLFIVVLVVVQLWARQRGGGPGRSNERPRKKKLLSDREQAMHHRLTEALPGHVVLSQVSFGALLSARSTAVRNTFDRKMADFVVCDRAFQVLAVIELDDASHRGKQAKDAQRDALLQAAGYRVIRCAHIPDIDQVRAAFAPPTPPAEAPSHATTDAEPATVAAAAVR